MTVTDDTRPNVLVGADLHCAVDATSIELGACVNLFQRDGDLVTVVRALEADGRSGVIAGTPMIRLLTTPMLRDAVSRVVGFCKTNRRGEVVQVPPPPDLIDALRQRGTWHGVKPLGGIAEAACLRADGTVCDTPGYDRLTGLIVETPALNVEAEPTREEAMAALNRLLALFQDFPFVSESARHVPIAAMLAMVARPAIQGPCPLFAFDASSPGSGKSLLADVVAAITTGRSAPRMTFPPDDAELEKMLSSAALFGSRLILLDNIANALGGPSLDKALTADDRIALRILGRSEIREVQWRAVVLASGNNLTLAGDTSRRTLIARLEPQVERPEERSGFRFSDLVDHAKTHRAAYVRDLLTLLRGFIVAGRPEATKYIWGSFQAFAGLVAGAIGWAGGPNILTCSAVALGAVSPERDGLRIVLEQLGSVIGEGATAREIVDALWPRLERGEGYHDGHDELRDAIDLLCRTRGPGEAPKPRILGIALRRFIGQVVGGRALRCKLNRTGSQTWQVEGAGTAGTCRDISNPSHARNLDIPIGSQGQTSLLIPAVPAVAKAS